MGFKKYKYVREQNYKKSKTHPDKSPLILHPIGQFCKKIKGKLFYDKKIILQRYLEQAAQATNCCQVSGSSLKRLPTSEQTPYKKSGTDGILAFDLNCHLYYLIIEEPHPVLRRRNNILIVIGVFESPGPKPEGIF